MNFISKIFQNDESGIRAFIPRIPHGEDSLFGILFFIFLVLPLIFIPVIDESFETPKMAFFLIVIGVLISWFVYKKAKITLFPKIFQVVVLVFTTSVIVSTIFSLDFSNSVVGMMGRPTNSALFLITWLITIYLLRSILNLEKALTIMRVIVFTGFLVSLYGILQQQGIGYYGGLEAGLRSWAPSFLGNPNFNSMFLAIVIPMALYCFSTAKKFLSKGYYGFVVLLMIWATAQFTSRAAILALMGALILSIVLLVIKRNFGSYLAINIVSLILIVLASYATLTVYRPDSLTQSIEFQETNQQSRLLVWDMSVEMIKENPWTGTGLSNFFIKFSEYGWSSFAFGDRYDDPHNIFLLLGVNGGVMMLASFLLLLIIIYYYGFKYISKESYHIALLSSITAWIIAGSFGPVVLACWVLLGFAIAAIFIQQNKLTIGINYPLLRYSLITFGIIVTLSGVLLISSYVFLAMSKNSFEREDYQKSLQMANLGKFWGAANSRVSYYQLRSMIRLGMPPELTEQELLKDVKRKSNAPPSYVSAASIYWHLWKQTGDSQYLDKMTTMATEAIKREPNYSNSHSQFAYLYYKAGMLEKALEHQRLSLTYQSNQFYGWVLLAKLYYDLGERERFLRAYELAAALNRDNFLVKGTLQAFREAEDYKALPFPASFPDPQ